MYCNELDIPLKELTRFIDRSATVDLSALLAYGKGIAEKKLRNIQKGLRFIENAEREIALTEKHRQNHKTYSREMPQKFFRVAPYAQSFGKSESASEIMKLFFDFEYGTKDSYELLEYGFLCEHSPSGIRRYAFMELPERKASARSGVKVIPAGTYFCKRSEESQIEQARQIFAKQLKGAVSFLAIETDVFVAKYKIDAPPVNELRVISVSG